MHNRQFHEVFDPLFWQSDANLVVLYANLLVGCLIKQTKPSGERILKDRLPVVEELVQLLNSNDSGVSEVITLRYALRAY